MWLVCAYYTNDEIYINHAKNFVASAKKFNLSYDISLIDSQGDWCKGMQYKPAFLKRMLEKHYPNSIVYVDIDAVFCRYPSFFDILDKKPNVSIAAHILDHSRYGRKNHPPELLSGTIFLKNNKKISIIINSWIEECSKNPRLWDQKALATVLKENDLCILPEEYCVIFDYMASVKNPVIKHFQASRTMRRAGNMKQVKIVIGNQTIHTKRIPRTINLRK